MAARNEKSSLRYRLFGRPAQPVLRPPGAAGEASFADDCTGCGDCIPVCPPGILVEDRGGLPMIELARGACTFCGACTEACPTPALEPDRPWKWRAEVQEDCMSLSAISCTMCQDVCEQNAISFSRAAGGRSVPKISLDDCTGCGNCVGFCPSSSIHLAQIG